MHGRWRQVLVSSAWNHCPLRLETWEVESEGRSRPKARLRGESEGRSLSHVSLSTFVPLAVASLPGLGFINNPHRRNEADKCDHFTELLLGFSAVPLGGGCPFEVINPTQAAAWPIQPGASPWFARLASALLCLSAVSPPPVVGHVVSRCCDPHH